MFILWMYYIFLLLLPPGGFVLCYIGLLVLTLWRFGDDVISLSPGKGRHSKALSIVFSDLLVDLSSKALKKPINSSTPKVSKFCVCSIISIVGSYLVGKVIKIFSTILLSITFSPWIFIGFTISIILVK